MSGRQQRRAAGDDDVDAAVVAAAVVVVDVGEVDADADDCGAVVAVEGVEVDPSYWECKLDRPHCRHLLRAVRLEIGEDIAVIAAVAGPSERAEVM